MTSDDGLGPVPVHDRPDMHRLLVRITRQLQEAADKVLTAVEQAKHERAHIAAAAGRLAQNAPAAWRSELDEVLAAAARIDTHLTDIMVAQAFHDLSGQTLARIDTLIVELEQGLLQLLEREAPRRGGSAGGQREVDQLLTTLGI